MREYTRLGCDRFSTLKHEPIGHSKKAVLHVRVNQVTSELEKIVFQASVMMVFVPRIKFASVRLISVASVNRVTAKMALLTFVTI